MESCRWTGWVGYCWVPVWYPQKSPCWCCGLHMVPPEARRRRLACGSGLARAQVVQALSISARSQTSVRQGYKDFKSSEQCRSRQQQPFLTFLSCSCWRTSLPAAPAAATTATAPSLRSTIVSMSGTLSAMRAVEARISACSYVTANTERECSVFLAFCHSLSLCELGFTSRSN